MHHPSVVSVYNAGQEDDLNYIVMEFIDGNTLQEYVTGGRSLKLRGKVLRSESRRGEPSKASTVVAVAFDLFWKRTRKRLEALLAAAGGVDAVVGAERELQGLEDGVLVVDDQDAVRTVPGGAFRPLDPAARFLAHGPDASPEYS